MFQGVTQHYNLYYKYDLPKDTEPGDRVNSLFDAVMRGDADALEEVIKILSGNTYYLVCNRLDSVGNATQEHVDDVMQNVRFEIVKTAFRGFPAHVTAEHFYGWLMGVVEICIKNFRKADKKKSRREEYDTEEQSEFDTMESKSADGSDATPEWELLFQERKELTEKILRKYVEALSESTQPPHRLMVYCYAILIPQLLKKTKNIELLRKVSKLSSRKHQSPNSWYNEEDNCLEGEIARDSIILMNWAGEAMYKQRIEQLDEEFLDIYDMEKLADMSFSWGTDFQNNLNREYDQDGMIERDVILTDKYKNNTISNWPKRVAAVLWKATEEKMIVDADAKKKAVNLVEDYLRG